MTMGCNTRGNYNALQTINRKAYCVDSDGYAVTDFVNVGRESDCDQYLYYMAE